MKIKCTECEYLIMHHRSGGTYIRFLKDFQQRLSETKQDALYALGQMNEKPDQQ